MKSRMENETGHHPTSRRLLRHPLQTTLLALPASLLQWRRWSLHCWSSLDLLHCLSSRDFTGLSANWSLIRMAAHSPAVSRVRRSASGSRARMPSRIALHPGHTPVSGRVRRSRTVSSTLSSTVPLQQAWRGVLRTVKGCVHAALPWVELPLLAGAQVGPMAQTRTLMISSGLAHFSGTGFLRIVRAN